VARKVAGTGNAVMPTDAPFFPDALLIKRAFVSRRDAGPHTMLALSLSLSLFPSSFVFAASDKRRATTRRRDEFSSAITRGASVHTEAHRDYNRTREGELINRVESITRFTSACGLPIN